MFILLIIASIVIAVIVAIGYASYSRQYSLPQTATAPSPSPPPNPVSATFTVNGQQWTDGTAINWGQLVNGDNTIPITITNTGSVAIASVSISSVGLPQGWTETITTGQPSGSTIPGTITLHAESSVSGTQSWTSTITLASS